MAESKGENKEFKRLAVKLSSYTWIIIEFFIWISISILYSLETIFYAYDKSSIYGTPGLSDILQTYARENSAGLIIAALIIIFPILFRLVFGAFPLLLLRNLIKGRYGTQVQIEGSNNIVTIDKKEKIDVLEVQPLEYLQFISDESDKLSKSIYSRSNAYLFVGSLIALIGILYFSFQVSNDVLLEKKNNKPQLTESILTLELIKSSAKSREIDTLINNATETVQKGLENIEINNSKGISDYFASYLPKFGALFFIEFIAFFFLRQYRITMDEFKYYEAIKRNREEVLFQIRYFEDAKDSPEKLEMMKGIISFYSNPDTIKKENTTELIEKRKLTKEETGIVEKLMDSLTKLKGT